MKTIDLDGKVFQIEIIRKTYLKNINLKISSPYLIRVTCNTITFQKTVIDFIVKNRKWIIKTNLNTINRYKKSVINYRNGEKIMFKGKNIPLTIKYHDSKMLKLEKNGNHLMATINNNLSSQQQKTQLKKGFEKFYKKYTIERCHDTINRLQNIKPQRINKISFKKLKSRWGSCSSKKNLNFSQELSKLPPAIQDYIIIHEYSHLFHLNHSQKFWNTVKFFDPDYQAKRKWLKEFDK